MTAQQYKGYKSYSYLRDGTDFESFDLVPELGRVDGIDLQLSEVERSRADKLLADSVVVSLHDHPVVFPRQPDQFRAYNRSARQRTGYQGLAESGMTAVFDNLMDGTACVTSQHGWKWDDIVLDIGMRRCDLAHQDFVRLADSLADIEQAHERGGLAVVLGLEAATPIENEVDRIDVLYGLGVRQMGIAYSQSNALGSGLKEARDGGLTAFGRQAVDRMNRLGIAIDISHSGDRTSMDVIEASEMPVFITHAGARSVWPTPRMKPDEVIVACAQAGGVIGIEAAPHTTVSREHPSHSLDSVMDHFTYLVDLVGIDHVAFGPDTLFGDHVALHKVFSSAFKAGEEAPRPPHEQVEYVTGLENPAENFINIIGWLVKHGYTDDQIMKVIGGNVIRVLEKVWWK